MAERRSKRLIKMIRQQLLNRGQVLTKGFANNEPQGEQLRCRDVAVGRSPAEESRPNTILHEDVTRRSIHVFLRN